MEPPAPARKRRLTPTQLLISLFGLGVLVGLISAVADQLTDERYQFLEWGMIAVLPVVLWLTLVWWRRLDEAAREAHKWAWYWGATVGILFVIPLLFLPDRLGVVDMARATGHAEPFELVAFGMYIVLVLQMIGYGVAWAVWWLRRR